MTFQVTHFSYLKSFVKHSEIAEEKVKVEGEMEEEVEKKK